MQTNQMNTNSNIMEEWLKSCPLPATAQRGAIIEGTVVRLDSKLGAWIDFGGKCDALVPYSEQDAPLTEGQKTCFFVMDFPEEDIPTFSHKRARPWIAMDEAKTTGEVMTVTAVKVRRNKSNGIAGISVKAGQLFGFVPYSMLGVRGKAVDELIGKEIPVKVTQVAAADRKLIFDHKTAAVESFVNQLQVNEVRQGNVVRIATFGAFVDLGNGVQGLLHNSQLSSAYRGDRNADGSRGEPRKKLNVGDALNVKVIELNAELGHIKLSLKGVPQGQNVQGTSEQA